MLRFIGAVLALGVFSLGCEGLLASVSIPDLAIWRHLRPRSCATTNANANATTACARRVHRNHGRTDGHGHRAHAGPDVPGRSVALSVFPAHGPQ